MSVVDVQRLDHPDDQAGHAGQGEFAGESEQRGVGVRQPEIGQPYPLTVLVSGNNGQVI